MTSQPLIRDDLLAGRADGAPGFLLRHAGDWHRGPPAIWVAAAYTLGSLLGLSLPFPETQVSVFWAPNAILLAALLISPRSSWRRHLIAVLPAHVAVQALMGIPFTDLLINFVGNAGEASIGALTVDHFLSRQERFDRFRAVALVMLFGGIVAPALASFVVAELFALTGSTVDPWVNWRLRLLNNALATFTLVPPIVLAFRSAPLPWSLARRRGEAGTLLVGLAVSALLLFGLPQAGGGHSPLLLYAPLPLLLWAAMRFGLVGASLSMLGLAVVSIWSTVQGRGPFEVDDPVQNATSLILFLAATSVPLLMLAALLEERESRNREWRSQAALHGAVLASMRDQIAVLDRDGSILEVNASWTKAGRPGPGADFLGELRRSAERDAGDASTHALESVAAVLRGELVRFQAELRSPPPSELWFEMSAEALWRPEGGAVIRYAEISDRLQAEEERRLQRLELAHLSRVAMLGELSGALAHELNQPLTAILSNAQAGQRFLARLPPDVAEVGEILHDIAEDGRRAGEVIQRLRALLRKGGAERVPLDLNRMAGEVLRFAHSDLIARNVTVTTRFDRSLRPVRGDRVQLQQVLLNLILNGCEAMSARPGVERRLAIVTGPDEDAAGVRVAVADGGTGIPPEMIERIFEPFVTTKEQGLGLGLVICRSIVEAHGGRLWAANNAEGGATF